MPIRSIVTSGDSDFISQGRESKVRIFNQRGEILGEVEARLWGGGDD
jgi:hypothetical protein